MVDLALKIAEKTNLEDKIKLAKLYARKAKVLYHLNYFKKSTQCYTKSLEYDDSCQKTKEGLSRAMRAREETEGKAELHNDKARQFFSKQEYSQAITEYSQAI